MGFCKPGGEPKKSFFVPFCPTFPIFLINPLRLALARFPGA